MMTNGEQFIVNSCVSLFMPIPLYLPYGALLDFLVQPGVDTGKLGLKQL